MLSTGCRRKPTCGTLCSHTTHQGAIYSTRAASMALPECARPLRPPPAAHRPARDARPPAPPRPAPGPAPPRAHPDPALPWTKPRPLSARAPSPPPPGGRSSPCAHPPAARGHTEKPEACFWPGICPGPTGERGERRSGNSPQKASEPVSEQHSLGPRASGHLSSKQACRGSMSAAGSHGVRGEAGRSYRS